MNFNHANYKNEILEKKKDHEHIMLPNFGGRARKYEANIYASCSLTIDTFFFLFLYSVPSAQFSMNLHI